MATVYLPHEVRENGSIYVRLVIKPGDLPYAEGKKAIWRAIGKSRPEAKRNHARALASAQDEYDAIRSRRAEAEGAAVLRAARRFYPKSADEIARDHYNEEVALDLASRTQADRSEVTDISWARPARLKARREVASGLATNNEMDMHVGWAIDEARRRGNHAFEAGTKDWRALAMQISRVELEVAERAEERN